jgi:hypothetical protein
MFMSRPLSENNAGQAPGPFVSPQQLAQLVMAARALQQRGGQSAAAGQHSVQAPRAFVLAPTDPFTAGAGATSGAGLAGPRPFATLANPDPAKAAAILSLRQPQANPQRMGTSASSTFPKLEAPSPEDIANGNYIIEGWRHLLRKDPAKIGLHAYTKIPVIENGKVKVDVDTGEPVFERWGVLGKRGSSKNQQVRDDPRNDGGTETWVKVTPEQREALRKGMNDFARIDEKGNFTNPCPVCGSRYGLLDRNSNTFQYNMRFWNPAGPIPSKRAPHPVLAPGDWKNEPNEQWYGPQSPQTGKK